MRLTWLFDLSSDLLALIVKFDSLNGGLQVMIAFGKRIFLIGEIDLDS